jgi:hypothetical protein
VLSAGCTFLSLSCPPPQLPCPSSLPCTTPCSPCSIIGSSLETKSRNWWRRHWFCQGRTCPRGSFPPRKSIQHFHSPRRVEWQ